MHVWVPFVDVDDFAGGRRGDYDIGGGETGANYEERKGGGRRGWGEGLEGLEQRAGRD